MPRDPSPSKPSAAARNVPQRPISHRERWLIRGLLAAAVLLGIVSVAATVGKDLLQMVVRQWEAGHLPVAEINPPQLSDLPPPVPELGLPPPPQVTISPPAVPVHSTELPEPTTDTPPADEAAVVFTEPIFDGHMIEPESPDAFPGPLAEDDLHDADRSLVDELFLDAGKDAAGNSGLAETAPLIPGLATASARERIKYSSAVKRVLNFLTEGDAADETDAEKSFAEARQICADDPRLPLAYGLYLQRIGQTATARTILEDCAEHEGKSYLLISQAAAVNRLLINDLRRAWPHLMHLADLTGQPARDTYPTDGQRRRAAEWLGAAAAFLESLPEDIDGRQFVNGAELRSHLPESLQAVFDTGQTETGRHLAEFTQWIGLPAGEAAGQLAEAIAKLEAQRQSAVKEIATFQESVHEATTGLRAANDLEKKSRGEWTLAVRQKRQAQEAIANLSQPRTYSYTQTTYTTTTDAQGRRQRVPQTVVRQRAENSSERSARLAQLQEASAALSKVDAVLPGLKNKFDQARLAREELVGHVRGQTAESRSQLAVAQRRLHQTERLLSRLQELTADPEKLSDRIHSPTLLLDWNVEEIADRLRATFDSPGKDRGP